MRRRPSSDKESHPASVVFWLGCAGATALVAVVAAAAGGLYLVSRSDAPIGPTPAIPSVPPGLSPVTQASSGTCKKTADCCREIIKAAGGGDSKSCDNFLPLPDDSCKQALTTYRETAARLNTSCD